MHHPIETPPPDQNRTIAKGYKLPYLISREVKLAVVDDAGGHGRHSSTRGVASRQLHGHKPTPPPYGRPRRRHPLPRHAPE
ncbi:hypothetical protein GQ55_9G614800 [Panicum hallii var. hallii]|uniref:Uncharacterized protein n=2 Tax=Panicum hallii TaxID=206008 RepID=A0A2T7CHQ1_9POAL|nr:hypothetical protein GQ55_9G614800 [Panicum hallii var. hallii]PVH33239.1 hypothetical protein PAHAL_9G605200 [Panicum hallii]